MLKKSDFRTNRKIWVLLCAELFFILIGVAGLFGKSGVVVGREDTRQLLEEGVALPAGVYTLKVYYDARGTALGNFGVAVEDAMYKTLLYNDVELYAGISERECQFYLLDPVEHLRAVLNVSDEVEILGMELYTGTEGSRIYLFWVILLCLSVNAVLFLILYNRRNPFPRDKKLALFSVPVLALTASLPILVDYNILGADWVFHISRIEALADCIRRGELSVRIESMWMAGHGYANSIFYADTWLVFPALLRILGFSMNSTYLIFLAAVNIATACISYISFSKCFCSRYIGILGCALYTLAPYRIYNMYNRAAVGEFLAMMFLPLLVWGFYKIYTEDPERKGYLWNWVIPVLGFSGVIQSHNLTCEMVGFFVILLCLILWKKTFRKRTFLVLCYTVVMTIIINAWYLVPLLDLMSADSYYFGNNANVLIQDRGILLAQIFYTLQAGGVSSRYVENGMIGAEPIGLGAALLICQMLWLMVRKAACGKNQTVEEQRERSAGDTGFVLLVIALFMSTRYFPWNYLSVHSRVLASLIGSLQFPTRMTTIVTVLGVFVACVMGRKLLRSNLGFLSGKTVLTFIVLVAVLFGSYQVNSILFTREEMIQLYTAQNVGTTAALGAEYLPLSADIAHMTYHDAVLSEGISAEAYQKSGLDVTARITAKEDGYMELPLLYYKGYRAQVKDTGEALPVLKGDNSDVRVLLPAGFQGEIRVWYGGMWYWRVAEGLSVAVGLGVLAYYVLVCFRRKRMRMG